MKNISDRWISMDAYNSIDTLVAAEGKRGTKRFCGRIVKQMRPDFRARFMSSAAQPGDVFFDSTSPLVPWYRK